MRGYATFRQVIESPVISLRLPVQTLAEPIPAPPELPEVPVPEAPEPKGIPGLAIALIALAIASGMGKPK